MERGGPSAPGCRTCPVGLALVPCRMQSKGLLFLGSPLALLLLSGLSFRCREPAMTSSCSVCPSLMTCKPLGCCYSFAALPAATTFSGCSPRRLRPSTPAPTTRQFFPPLRTFLAWMAFPTVLDGSPSCPCRWVALAWCLLLRLLSLLIGRLGRIACLSSVSLCDGVPAPTLQEDGPSTFVRGWRRGPAVTGARPRWMGPRWRAAAHTGGGQQLMPRPHPRSKVEGPSSCKVGSTPSQSSRRLGGVCLLCLLCFFICEFVSTEVVKVFSMSSCIMRLCV